MTYFVYKKEKGIEYHAVRVVYREAKAVDAEEYYNFRKTFLASLGNSPVLPSISASFFFCDHF